MKPLHLFTTLVAATALLASADAQDRPNVILMMADDLANEDLSCYGSTRIKTPRLDAMAKEGLKLTGYYAGNPVCSPSRMALLSGSYPARLGWRWGVLGYGFPGKSGMNSKVHTIAEAFRDSGYRTAISGKWHLGVQGMAPEDQGFQSAYYIRMSNNQNRDMFRDGKLVQEKWDNALLTETFAEEVIRVINEKSDKPFFLYVPWSAPHFPVDPHPDWKAEPKAKITVKYTKVVEELDARIGHILDALKKAGKEDNTIVIFTSDNGRQQGQAGPNDVPPFTGHKWQSMEGGTRVPFIIRYPKSIPVGKESNDMLAAIDLFPTLASACDVQIKLPEGAQKLDGVNAWPMLTKLSPNPARTELLYWHGKGPATAIRQGDWKLRFNISTEKPLDPELGDGPSLHNLKTDPLEAKNLAKEHPEKVEALLKRAKELLTEVYAEQIPLGTWPDAELTEEPLKASDVWGKWVK